MSKEMQLLTWSCGDKLVSLGVGKKNPIGYVQLVTTS